MNRTEPLDLLVIGAGPVGLSAAVAAVHRGAKRVLVVEQARSLGQAGRGMDLLPNAVRTLAALAPDVDKLLKPYKYTPVPGTVRALNRSANGRKLGSIVIPEYGELASVKWWQLQGLLLKALPEGDFLVLNHQLADIVHEPDSDLACAEFIVNRQRRNDFKNWDGDHTDVESTETDGSSQHTGLASPWFFEVEDSGGISNNQDAPRRVRCRAKVVIGADGINSVARRCIYRDCFPNGEKLAEAEYAGYTRVGGMGVPSLEEEESVMQEKYIGNAVLCLLTCDEENISPYSPRSMFANVPLQREKPNWYTNHFLAIEEQTVKDSSPTELTKVAVSALREAHFPEELIRMSTAIWAGEPDSILIRVYYNVPATYPPPYDIVPTTTEKTYPDGFHRPWHHGRVVLVGDAAHAAPNFLAQGGAMGLEDAFELVIRLASSGLWAEDETLCPDKAALEKLFAEYHSVRLDRVCPYQKWTMNRVSEHDWDALVAIREKLWRYDPARAEEAVKGSSIIQ